MASDIALKIYIPEKLLVDKSVYRIVLPCDGKTLTVIKDRAPTLLALDMGTIRILNEADETVEEIFVSGGAVDIKENTCTILTEGSYNKNDMSLDRAKALNEEFPNFFHEWLIKVFEKETKK